MQSLADYSILCLCGIIGSLHRRRTAATLRKFLLSRIQSRPFPAMPHETMILISVRDYNQFSQNYYDSVINSLPFHQLTCTCGHSACLSVHAYYRRGVFIPSGVQSLRICRVRCSECGKTHALLPSSLVPYDRITLPDQHRIILAYQDGTDRNAICEENPTLDENCVKAVIRRFLFFWLQRLLSEAVRLASLPPLVETCCASYSMQFMQVRRIALRLFAGTT